MLNALENPLNPSGQPIMVAGVTVLDFIPTFPEDRPLSLLVQNGALLSPGQLVLCGQAVAATGGAAPNTGLALHRLGFPVRLSGRVGDDLFGKIIVDLLAAQAPELTAGLTVVPGETTSYSFVINPPGFDRAFLHCTGANDTFTAEDVPANCLAGAKLFHFGYLNVMRQMYLEQGKEMQRLFRRVKSQGLVTSLDIAFPDLASESIRLDWPEIFKRVLPDVDFFLPSFNESLVLLDRPAYDRLIELAGTRKDSLGGILSGAGMTLVVELGDRLLEMGVAVLGLKLGDQGFYLRTTPDRARLDWIAQRLPINPDLWLNRECLAPCFKVAVAGTVGAGDATIAGFLAGAAVGQSPEAAMTSAVAAGACCVEAADATSGILAWEALQARIAGGWERLPMRLSLTGWQWDAMAMVWRSPRDRN